MFGALPNKTKQFFFFIIKLSIVIGAIYFIYTRVVQNENLKFDVFLDFLLKNDVFLVKNLCFLIIFTLFNWFFEILKWKILTGSLIPMTLLNSTKQSLAALTASLITPNRIGDYAAKIAYFPKAQRRKVLLLNLLGHMAQMSATLIFGMTGLYFFVEQFGLDIPLFKAARAIALITLVFLIGFLIPRNSRFRIRGFGLENIKEFVNSLQPKIKWITLMLSILRYLIFSSQFVWLLHIFGVEGSYFTAMVVISTFYLIASVVPTFVITDVLVKGSVALYLFNLAGVNDLTILSIVSLMWIMNFALPAIFGGFFVLNFKTLNTNYSR